LFCLDGKFVPVAQY